MSDDIIQRLLDAIPHQSRDNGLPTILRQAKVMREAATEIEKQRAENDELYRAAGMTRAALSGWILASPDREDEPTHALVAALVAEVERLRVLNTLLERNDERRVDKVERHRAENERLREAIRTSRARCVELELKNESLSAAADHAGAALAAAIELLERGREDAPSKRMFSQMLADYRVIVARTRRALEG